MVDWLTFKEFSHIYSYQTADSYCVAIQLRPPYEGGWLDHGRCSDGAWTIWKHFSGMMKFSRYLKKPWKQIVYSAKCFKLVCKDNELLWVHVTMYMDQEYQRFHLSLQVWLRQFNTFDVGAEKINGYPAIHTVFPLARARWWHTSDPQDHQWMGQSEGCA